MLTEKIEIFLEVADSLCFSEVAKKRYTTQPTISRQIGALEEEWGIPLFVRSNKGLRLTPEGSVMLRCCRKMYQQCESALRTARELKFEKNGSLRLGFLEILDTERIFMPYLRAFSGRYPEVELSVFSESFSGLRKGLLRDQFDVIYTFDFDVQSMSEDIVINRLGELQPMFVISRYHPLFTKEHLTVADCLNECFFLPEEKDSPGRTADLQRILRANGIGSGKIRMVPNLDSALMQMRMGRGVAIADTGTKGIRHPDYRMMKLEKQNDSIGLVSGWKKENLNPFLPLFVNHQTADLETVAD